MDGNFLTDKSFQQAIGILRKRDPDIEGVVRALGPPPMWLRDLGFPTLVRIILEQQVSLASAKAAHNRLQKAVPALTPNDFLKLDSATLRKSDLAAKKPAIAVRWRGRSLMVPFVLTLSRKWMIIRQGESY